MSKNVSVVKIEEYEYPNKTGLFRPSKEYPEYILGDLSEEENHVYDAIRESFHQLNLDDENYGTKDWNPMGTVVNPGDYVLIKPNMVMDINRSEKGDENSLYTNPSVVAAVIDYVIIAMKGEGKIVVGDAPMQECDFERLITQSGYKNLIEYYKNKKIDIELVDFRELSSIVKNGVHIASINENAKGKVIDLGCDSDFYGESDENIKNMRITNYDPNIMPEHHNHNRHEYYISEYALNADVIINMPKPKCHRKAGMTSALKNFVGLNVRKEYLPHHTKGAKNAGGDEYDKKNIIHDIRSSILDKKNVYQTNGKYFQTQVCRVLIKVCSVLLRLMKKNKYDEGSWYGNRTISRTVSDINKIIYYSDKNGILKDEKQRKFFIVGDMIVSGEDEGPVFPTNKNCGIIVMGDNPVAFDKAVATIMGFDYKKIPTIVNANIIKKRYTLVEDNSMPNIISNDKRFNGINIEKMQLKNTYAFNATSGWKGHIEL